jgi:hypothetical protein
MGWLSDNWSIVGAQVKPYWCNWHSSGIPRMISTLDHMPLFEKSKSILNLPTKPYTLEWPWGMFENRTPHGRHAPGIFIYVLTLPALLMPHSSLTLPSVSQTQAQQINQYACHQNPCTIILCPLCLFLFLFHKFNSWTMHSFLYTNPLYVIIRLWMIAQWLWNLWQSNGHHQTLMQPH